MHRHLQNKHIYFTQLLNLLKLRKTLLLYLEKHSQFIEYAMKKLRSKNKYFFTYANRMQLYYY